MRWLWRNFWLKIIAFAMGLLIWLHVATEKVYNHDIKLPVAEIILQDSLTLAGPPPDSVSVEVSASGKQLLRRKWRQAGLRIQAAGFAPGSHTLTLSPDNTTLVSQATEVQLENILTPVIVQLNVDRESSTLISITADLETEADDGFAVGKDIILEPDSVLLVGPRSRLDRIRTILTEPRTLKGLRNGVTITMALLPPAGYGYELRPDSVNVTIPVVPIKTKIFEDLPIVIFHPPTGAPMTIQPERVRVEISGPPDEIDQLVATAVSASIDLRGVDSSTKVALNIDCPPAFRVRRTSVDSILVIPEPDADSGY